MMHDQANIKCKFVVNLLVKMILLSYQGTVHHCTILCALCTVTCSICTVTWVFRWREMFAITDRRKVNDMW